MANNGNGNSNNGNGNGNGNSNNGNGNGNGKGNSDIITVNGMEYNIRKLDVGLNHIQFITNDLTIHNAIDIFKDVDTISLSKSNSTESYATYETLRTFLKSSKAYFNLLSSDNCSGKIYP